MELDLSVRAEVRPSTKAALEAAQPNLLVAL